MKSLLTFLVLSLTMVTAYAQKSEIFETDGKAIRGYDPVAFFVVSKPVRGSDSLTCAYKGSNWLFSSRENLNLFKSSPEKYAPQFGGYCAYGMADGHKAPTETDTWSVIDGRLYFNYNQKVKTMWDKDKAALITKANGNWPQLKNKE